MPNAKDLLIHLVNEANEPVKVAHNSDKGRNILKYEYSSTIFHRMYQTQKLESDEDENRLVTTVPDKMDIDLIEDPLPITRKRK